MYKGWCQHMTTTHDISIHSSKTAPSFQLIFQMLPANWSKDPVVGPAKEDVHTLSLYIFVILFESVRSTQIHMERLQGRVGCDRWQLVPYVIILFHYFSLGIFSNVPVHGPKGPCRWLLRYILSLIYLDFRTASNWCQSQRLMYSQRIWALSFLFRVCFGSNALFMQLGKHPKKKIDR